MILEIFYFSRSGWLRSTKKVDEDGIFETTSQVEEGEAPKIINTDQDIKGASRLEWNIENLPLVLTGVCTIDSEDVVELRRISIMVVDDNEYLEDNIPSVGVPVTEGELYDGNIWVADGIDPRKASNRYRSGPKLPFVSPSIVTSLTLLD